MSKLKLAVAAAVASTAFFSTGAMADCKTLLSTINGSSGTSKSVFAAVQTAIGTAAQKATGGYGLPMWVTVVDESGIVCAVSTTPSAGTSGNTTNDSFADWGLKFTSNTGPAAFGNENPWGSNFTKATSVTGKALKLTKGTNANVNAASNVQWLASRVISSQKATTANSLSIDGYAIGTASLYTATKEGNSLYGLQHSNPVDASITYLGTAAKMGTASDPLVKKRSGGINVFGGGLALYNGSTKVGAIGVSGDTACRDHAFAWEVRSALGLDDNTGGITTANGGYGTTNKTLATKVTALTGAAKGDEMIVDLNGLTVPTGGTIITDITVDGTGYWANNWSHPACVNMVKHASTIFTN